MIHCCHLIASHHHLLSFLFVFSLATDDQQPREPCLQLSASMGFSHVAGALAPLLQVIGFHFSSCDCHENAILVGSCHWVVAALSPSQLSVCSSLLMCTLARERAQTHQGMSQESVLRLAVDEDFKSRTPAFCESIISVTSFLPKLQPCSHFQQHGSGSPSALARLTIPHACHASNASEPSRLRCCPFWRKCLSQFKTSLIWL